MVLRSEREAKPFGTVIVELESPGEGRLLMINLAAWSQVYKAQLMVRKILENLDVFSQTSG
jgi:hypothetical protein